MASAGWASFPVPSWFYCSATQSCPTLQPHGLQYPRLPLSLTISQSLLNLMSLSQWCHPSISSSVTPFSSCPQSLPASGSFPVSWLFASGGQNIKASASASLLPMNIQGWFPSRSTGLIFFLTKGLSRVLQHHSVKASILQCSAFFMVQLLHPYSSVQSLSRVQLFATPWTTAHQASLSITNSQTPSKPMSIESVMPSNHLTLCYPLLLLPSILPSIRVFSNESALHIRWPKYWSFSFSISPSNEYSGLIFFRID